LAAAIGLVAVWQLSVQLLAIPDYLLPGPRAVVAMVLSERALILQHGLITLYEAGLGFTLALVFAVPVSVIIVWSKVAEKTLLPLMVFLQTVPKVAIAPLFIIWFGFGPFPKVLISFLLAYFPIVIEMVTGLRDVNPTVLDLARSMSVTPFQTFTKIRIPNSLPYLFSGLKLGALLSLVGAIVAEFMGSMDGLGYLVLYANDRMDTTLCFAVLLVLLLLGKALFSLVEWVERHAIAWHVVVRENEPVMFTT
jgi:NitT/TauT family transport system permease protein